MSLKYGKPPITEAILDIRVEPRPGASAIEIDAAFAALRGDFPTRQEIAEDSLPIAFASSLPLPFTGGAILGGFRYESADNRRIVQARRDAFVFSLLPPYTDWDDFSGQAYHLWENYVGVWRPERVTRAALRYVNRFELAGKTPEEVQKFLGMLPRFPRSEAFLPPQNLAGFSLQLILPQSDFGATVILNHALLTAPPDTASLILDIDIYCDGLNWSATDFSQLHKAMQELRGRKNDIFQASVTQDVDDLLEREL